MFKSKVNKTVLPYKNCWFSPAIFDSSQSVGAQCNDIMFTEKICTLERYLLLLGVFFIWRESFRNGQEIGLKHCAVCQNKVLNSNQTAVLLSEIDFKGLTSSVVSKENLIGESFFIKECIKVKATNSGTGLFS